MGKAYKRRSPKGMKKLLL